MNTEAEPDVSVVLPVRNGERTLERAIRSILAQTVTNFELLVVDDGSDDATAEVVQSFDDPRIRLVRSNKRGISGACELAIGLSRAPVIARQDADDESDPGRLEAQLDLLRSRPDVVVVGVNWREADASGQPVEHRRRFRSGDVGRLLLVANPIIHGGVAFRKEVARAVGGYDLGVSFAQDYDLWLRMAEQGTIWNMADVLATRHMDGTNIAGKREQRQHREALRARLRTVWRRRNPVLVLLVYRGLVSVLLPPQLKRPIRRLRHQAP